MPRLHGSLASGAVGLVASLLLIAGCTIPSAGCDIVIAGSAIPIDAGEPLPAAGEVIVAARDIDPAQTRIATNDMGDPVVELVLRGDAADRFAAYTAEHIGGFLVVAVNGAVASSPAIMAAIDGGAIQLTGPSDDPAWVERFSGCAPVEVFGG